MPSVVAKRGLTSFEVVDLEVDSLFRILGKSRLERGSDGTKRRSLSKASLQ